jgi:hypothetical protein
MVGMPRKNEMILRLVERLPLYIDKANHPAPPRSRSSIELCRDAGRSKKPPHREPVRGRSPAEQGLCKRMIEPVEMRFASALGQFIEAGGDVTRERRWLQPERGIAHEICTIGQLEPHQLHEESFKPVQVRFIAHAELFAYFIIVILQQLRGITAIVSGSANTRVRVAAKRRRCTVTGLANSALDKWLGGRRGLAASF